jgi:hypothetical protein
MKTFYLTPVIIVCLLLSTNALQAQTTQPKLNQLELLQQFIGSWKCDVGKDTTAYWDAIPFGTGFDITYKFVTNGKIFLEGRQLRGYVKKIDKCIMADITKGEGIDITAFWFTSKNKGVNIPYDDISNPDKAIWKAEWEYKTPDLYLETPIINNKPGKTATWTRIKK